MKPGWKTSEFAVTVMMLLMAFLKSGLLSPTSVAMQIVAFIVAGATGVGFVASRTIVKAADAAAPSPGPTT